MDTSLRNNFCQCTSPKGVGRRSGTWRTAHCSARRTGLTKPIRPQQDMAFGVKGVTSQTCLGRVAPP